MTAPLAPVLMSGGRKSDVSAEHAVEVTSIKFSSCHLLGIFNNGFAEKAEHEARIVKAQNFFCVL